MARRARSPLSSERGDRSKALRAREVLDQQPSMILGASARAAARHRAPAATSRRKKRSSRKSPCSTSTDRSPCAWPPPRARRRVRAVTGARPARTSPLLQHAQRLGLQSSGHVADLVEEERAAARPARSRPTRCCAAPVNAPRAWPNSSLSSSGSGHRRAVDRDERRRRAAPSAWMRARDQLLAGAGLAGDQHRASPAGSHAAR